MIVLIYPFAVMASMVITLFCVLMGNWLVVLFADEAGNLPRWCRWFQTFDDTLDAGVRDGLFDYGSRYLNRVAWLLRNPAYGFDYYLLGLRWNLRQWQVIRYESTPKRDLFIAAGNGFNVYYQGPLGTYKLGWKAWNHFDPASGQLSRSWGDNRRIPICFSCNPFRRKTD